VIRGTSGAVRFDVVGLRNAMAPSFFSYPAATDLERDGSGDLLTLELRLTSSVNVRDQAPYLGETNTACPGRYHWGYDEWYCKFVREHTIFDRFNGSTIMNTSSKPSPLLTSIPTAQGSKDAQNIACSVFYFTLGQVAVAASTAPGAAERRRAIVAVPRTLNLGD
jgi:hypothetical protein